MRLQRSYTLLAPIYDPLVAGPTQRWRAASLQRLRTSAADQVLLGGVGSGLDIPLLPEGPVYTAFDLTPAMIARAVKRARRRQLPMRFQIANAVQLPYAEAVFDWVVLHLILAVVSDPETALLEAQRVLKPGGRIIVLDKFLRRGQRAVVRRLFNPIARRIATRLDVVFEDVLQRCGQLRVVEDSAAEPTGWFRHIVLEKQAQASPPVET